jgi:23S rRNA pseudouridine1911/1915/1917 synthase
MRDAGEEGDELATEDEQSLYEHHRIKVDKGQESLRIDRFLAARLGATTRTRVQNACEAGFVIVNGKPAKSNYRIKPGDEISIVLTVPPRIVEVKPENIPVNIVYEDEYLAVVNKAAGMVVHPGYGNYTGTLVNALAWHFQNLPKTKTKLNNDQVLERPGLVHRIDKNTTGLVIIAKTELAMMKLARELYDRKMDRRYVAICWGQPKQKEGTIRSNVGRDPRNRKVMTVFSEDSGEGKLAITHYKVIESFGYVSVVECTLETGRTHQIRVHMKSIGHPLFNDHEYGGNEILKGQNTGTYKQFIRNCFELLPRQALHAKTLGIIHPVTGKKMLFEADLPDDMKTVIEKWRRFRTGGREDSEIAG